MARVIWTPEALRDLETIAGYMDENAPTQRETLLSAIVSSTRRLSTFPESGRIVPEIARADVREIIHGEYRVVYRRTHDAVRVARVLHARSDIRRRLRRLREQGE